MSIRNKLRDLFAEAETRPSTNPVIAQVWKIKTTPKIKHFLWRALQGAISVSNRVKTRGLKVIDGCLLCGVENETVNHVLFKCSLSRQVLTAANVSCLQGSYGESLFEKICHLFSNKRYPKLSNWLPHGLRGLCGKIEIKYYLKVEISKQMK